MKINLYRPIAVSLFAVVGTVSFAASDEDILQAFHKKYDNLSSMSCKFTSSGFQGTMYAVRGGKYRIELGERSIVSDGKAVYNIQYTTKTVVINKYDDKTDDISVEKILFTLLNVYRAEVIMNTSKLVLIRLLPPDKDATIAGVDKVELTCTRTLDLRLIDVYNNSMKTTWSVQNLKLNNKINTAQLTFSPPAGWQTVDLR
ncbi:MAG: outer-membrane lipoprotein carrier protein LolA [Ignavibacteria bacterium]|nr:outer-membrane lipoprotein carrier protein LolA [Ignavibacteria bacterium]